MTITRQPFSWINQLLQVFVAVFGMTLFVWQAGKYISASIMLILIFGVQHYQHGMSLLVLIEMLHANINTVAVLSTASRRSKNSCRLLKHTLTLRRFCVLLEGTLSCGQDEPGIKPPWPGFIGPTPSSRAILSFGCFRLRLCLLL